MDMKCILSAVVVCTSLFSSIHAKNVEASLEESLELRKISEYWKEKDYATAKVQIREFLSRNPKSSYVDQLNAMLGDLQLQEKEYAAAVAAYDKVEGNEFSSNVSFIVCTASMN